jgi:hypothetical protein
MSGYHLAQLNIATLRTPLESPEMADFVNNLARINQLAEASAGYVWRLETEEGDATALRPFGEGILVNMSVWQDLGALRDFVFGSDHVQIMRRRREWFPRMAQAYVVFWWIPAGHRPSVEEARERLELLRAQGPTARAFTFRHPFPAPDAPAEASVTAFLDECPAG